MDEERDYIVCTDEDGNELELDVIDYFDYNGEEYAILAECGGDCECCDEPCEDEECNFYIMRIIVDEENDTEEFVPPEDEDMEALAEIAERILSEEFCGEDCDCCDDEDCGCHEPGCTCGCEDK